MEKRQKQKIIISLISAIAILLILAVVWLLSKSYRFSQYKDPSRGFSLVYPADWTLEENKNGAAVIFYSPVENALDLFKENVNIVVQDISRNPLNLDKYTEIAIHQLQVVFKQNIEILESSPAYIGDLPAYKLVYIGKGKDFDMKFTHVWTIKGDYAYQFTYTANVNSYDKFSLKVDRMLSSFHIQ